MGAGQEGIERMELNGILSACLKSFRIPHPFPYSVQVAGLQRAADTCQELRHKVEVLEGEVAELEAAKHRLAVAESERDR